MEMRKDTRDAYKKDKGRNANLKLLRNTKHSNRNAAFNPIKIEIPRPIRSTTTDKLLCSTDQSTQ